MRTHSAFSCAALAVALSGLAGCIDFRKDIACGTDADCDGYLCEAGKCVPSRMGGGIAAKFRIDSLPEHVKAGTQQAVQLSALDAAGHLVQNFTGQAALTSSDAQALLPSNPAFAGGTAQAMVTFKSVGAQSLTVTQPDAPAVTGSAATVVLPGDAASYVLTPAGAPHVGVAVRVDAVAMDGFGNVTTAYAGTASVAATDPRAQLPGNVSFSAGSASFQLTLKTAGAQSVTARDVAQPTITGAATVSVAGGDAASYVVTGPSHATAGAAAAFTVTAKDLYGNVAALYGGAAGVTATDARAVVPSGIVFSSGVANGVVITFKTAGPQSVSFKDPGNGALTVTTGVVVDPGGASIFDVTGLPAQAITAGGNASFSLTARDSNGNLVPSYSGSAQLSSTDLQAVFPQASVAFSSGSPTVSGVQVKFKTAGSQKVIATDAVSGCSGEGTALVAPSSFNRIGFVTQPSVVRLGATMSPAVQVGGYDTFGNMVPSFSATIALGNVTAGVTAKLGGTLTRAATQGIAVFDDLTITAPLALKGLVLTKPGEATSDPFDTTAPWEPVTTTGNPDLYSPNSILVGPGGTLYALGRVSNDSGATWTGVGAAQTRTAHLGAIDPMTAGRAYGLSAAYGPGWGAHAIALSVSTDDSLHWGAPSTAATYTDSVSSAAGQVFAFAGSPTRLGAVFSFSIEYPVGGGVTNRAVPRVRVSNDGGASWSDASGLPADNLGDLNNSFDLAAGVPSMGNSAVRVDAGHPGVAYLLANRFGPYRTGDYGATWTSLASSLTNYKYLTDLVVAPLDDSRVYVAVSCASSPCSAPQLFSSLDPTTGWTEVAVSGVPPARVWPGETASELMGLSGTTGSLVLSTDRGQSWTPVSLGLPEAPVSVLALPGVWIAVSKGALFRTTTRGQ